MAAEIFGKETGLGHGKGGHMHLFSKEPAFGCSGYAERVNGRFAMVGFIAVLLIEALSGETFLRWAGLVP